MTTFRKRSRDERTPENSDSEVDIALKSQKQTSSVFSSPSSDRSSRTSRNSSAASSRSSSPSRPKRYICTFKGCGKAYSRPSVLEQHQRAHTNTRPFKCASPGCDESFTRKDHLQRHHLKHTSEEEKPYHCSICNKGVNSSQHLKRHEKTHYKSFICNYENCKESFFKHQSLKAHINSVHNSERLKCSHCGKKFTRPGKLTDHIDKHHGSERSKLVCDFQGCFKDFRNWSALQLHIKTDHPKLSCVVCAKKCVGPSGLANHMKIHDESTVVKIWRCFRCTEKFSKKEDLLNHYENNHPSVELPEFLAKQPVQGTSSDQQKIEEPLADLTQASDDGEGEEGEEEELNELGFPVTQRLRTSFKKDFAKGKIKSALDLIIGNVEPKGLECIYTNCYRTFRRQYDLDRHLTWHEKQDVEIDKRLKDLYGDDVFNDQIKGE